MGMVKSCWVSKLRLQSCVLCKSQWGEPVPHGFGLFSSLNGVVKRSFLCSLSLGKEEGYFT